MARRYQRIWEPAPFIGPQLAVSAVAMLRRCKHNIVDRISHEAFLPIITNHQFGTDLFQALLLLRCFARIRNRIFLRVGAVSLRQHLLTGQSNLGCRGHVRQCKDFEWHGDFNYRNRGRSLWILQPALESVQRYCVPSFSAMAREWSELDDAQPRDAHNPLRLDEFSCPRCLYSCCLWWNNGQVCTELDSWNVLGK